ncbi:myeloid differentiation primary response protein MyD88-like isoform X4 [Mercenaria mercenaria]|uniref:myeloid differentiation primary response protein MyD88-like isoform X1 n=1 Tax=Mercenaria mercenaria TaxID=6596 RepID=UPI00234F5B59|nr:myeloid differentiation primary response protein MyD88-like isoform X1 [Mercenaria mercenaria]XP_053387757.1 myeloid differentiation primary response protein MyD88-like isoform X3 [Mercenaria mercenaria]XP_053387758.1 myeloid differentiation primary response protein MyD88-like isoform X4 [Mercenaria mercenaria]
MARAHLSADNIENLFSETPLDALNVASSKILEDRLNPVGKLVELKDGSGIYVFNNFTGIAEQEHFSPEEVKDISDNPNPTNELITEMSEKSCTIGDLFRDLLNMGRIDIVQNSQANWVKDCHVYAEKRGAAPQMVMEIPDQEIEEEDCDEVNLGHTKQYDAFLSYAYPNLRIAKRTIRKLENEGFTLFVPGRDDLPGGAKHVLTAYVIEKRCKRVIILLTKAFRSSPECDFQVRFANALDPGAIEMKIIPVICEDNVEVPRFLNFIHTCDITKNEWSKLYRALSHQCTGENTRLLESLTYPPPVNVENEFRQLNIHTDNISEDRYQPDGDSGIVHDIKAQDGNGNEVYV